MRKGRIKFLVVDKSTEEIKKNIDGSLDIYIQKASTRKYKESDWLPSLTGVFSHTMHNFLSTGQILNGMWPYL